MMINSHSGDLNGGNGVTVLKCVGMNLIICNGDTENLPSVN